MEKLLALSLVILWLQLASELGLLVMGRGWSKFRTHKTEGQNLLFNWEKWKVKVLATQSCLTPCDLMDCGPPGSSVPGIFQARTLEWVAIPFSRRSSWSRDQSHISWIAGRFFTTVPPGKPVNWEMYPQIMEGNANASDWKCSDWLLDSVLMFLPRGE